MQFPAKAIAIYFIKKTDFDGKNNHQSNNIAYF